MARRTGIPETAVASYDERPQSRLSRLIGNLARVPSPSGDEFAERGDLAEREMRTLDYALDARRP